MSGDGEKSKRFPTVHSKPWPTRIQCPRLTDRPLHPFLLEIAPIPRNESVIRPRKIPKAHILSRHLSIGAGVPHPTMVEASSLCRMALQSLRSQAAARDPLSLSVEDRRLQASNKSSDLAERLPRDANFPNHMVDTQGDLTDPGRRTSIFAVARAWSVGARPGCSTASSRISPILRWDDQRGTRPPIGMQKGPFSLRFV